MSKKVGAYDYQTLHVLHEGSGVFSLFERRLKQIVVTPSGKPLQVLPDDVGLSFKLKVMEEGNRIVQGYALVPVKEHEEE